MRMQGLPTFPPRVNMTYYERKYARLRTLADSAGGTTPQYRIMFYLEYDKTLYRLIKETKYHLYFVQENNEVITRIAKKSHKTYLYFPSYGMQTVSAVMYEKMNRD